MSTGKVVTLRVDKIHIKSYFDYVGGSIVGSAFDSAQAARSVFVFMVSSIISKFKDVVHMVPAKCMKDETLYDILRNVNCLHNIGFHVICVVTDNNAINAKAMKLFAEPTQLSMVYPPSSTHKQAIVFHLRCSSFVEMCQK